LLLLFIVQKKPIITKQELVHFEGLRSFKVKLGSNSYKKSGKIGEELNSWMNPGSLAKTSSGAPEVTEIYTKLLYPSSTGLQLT